MASGEAESACTPQLQDRCAGEERKREKKGEECPVWNIRTKHCYTWVVGKHFLGTPLCTVHINVR